MAVTSIWAVKGRVDNVIKYIENPDKTIDRPELSQEAIKARMAVGDVIDYAVNEDKTEKMMYVTGINCNPDTAAEDFMVVKRRWHKEDGRLAYHGYQAFKEGEGEITAQQVHEIGVRLAKEIWGDRYQVVVATHLNTGHYHNHFVVNSVSYIDGKKYVRTKADYWEMRNTSDRLCREIGAYVIEKTSSGRGKHYAEWKAEKEGRPTIRGMIREDIDYAMRVSLTDREFVRTLKDMGYEFKFHTKDGYDLAHPCLKPPGAQSFIRFRSLGPEYDFDTIRRKVILSATLPGVHKIPEVKPYREWNPPPETTMGILPKIYRRYCIRLYGYVRQPRKREYIPMAIREDIIKLDHYIEQMDFLNNNHVDDKTSLSTLMSQMRSQLEALYDKRKSLYARKKWLERHEQGELIPDIKQEIKDTSLSIRDIKKKIRICDEVFISSEEIMRRLEMPVKAPEPIKVNKGTRRIR